MNFGVHDVQTALDDYKLCVGETGFSFSDATHSSQNLAVWSSTGLSWSSGDVLFLTIVSTGATCTAGATTATVTLAATPSLVDEGQNLSVFVYLSAAFSNAVTVPITVTRSTAEAADIGSFASSVTISAGSLIGVITIPTNQDADTDDETFTVSLGTLPAGLTAGSPSSGTVVIEDDETPARQQMLSLSADRAPREGGGDVTVTATLGRTLSHDVEVAVILDGTATWGGSETRTRFSSTPDYWTPIPAGARRHTWFDKDADRTDCQAAGLFLIPAGQIAASFTIRVIDDTHPDAGETIVIEASLQRYDREEGADRGSVTVGYLGHSAALTLTVANDDTGPVTAVQPIVPESVLRYDANGDGAIDHGEYDRAARDYADGKITYGYLLPVVDAYRAFKDGAGGGDTGGDDTSGDGPGGDDPGGDDTSGDGPGGDDPGGGDNLAGGDPGGDGSSGGSGSPGAGGSSGPGATPASAPPEPAALSTQVIGRRARAIDSPHCFVPGAAELGALGASTHLAYRLDSGKDFDLCLWAPDPNWRAAPAYATCRGTGGALPEYASLVEGAGREELSAERALGLMACIVPAEAVTEGGAWQLRIAPDNPEPEDTE